MDFTNQIKGPGKVFLWFSKFRFPDPHVVIPSRWTADRQKLALLVGRSDRSFAPVRVKKCPQIGTTSPVPAQANDRTWGCLKVVFLEFGSKIGRWGKNACWNPRVERTRLNFGTDLVSSNPQKSLQNGRFNFTKIRTCRFSARLLFKPPGVLLSLRYDWFSDAL